MVVSGCALAAALAVLVVARVRWGRRWRGLAWALGALALAWLAGYAALARAGDLALLAGVPGVRAFAFGGWAGAPVALIGAWRVRGRA